MAELAQTGAGSRYRVALAILPLAFALHLTGCERANTETAKAAPPPAVTIIMVSKKEVTPVLKFSGRIEAIDKVDLRARIDGFLVKRQFTEGGEVKSGDVLFTLEKAPYTAEVAKIKAAVQRAEAVLTLAKIELDRQDELVRKQVAAQARLDEARAKYAESQADLAKDKAELEQAVIRLGYTDIIAPIAGQIGRSVYSVGAYLTPSSSTLATIVSREPMYVTFPVTQRELLEMRRRAQEEGLDRSAIKVMVRLADGTRYDQSGSISFVDVQVNQTADTLTVRAELPNPKRLLIDGQLVTVEVEIAEPRASIVIPQQALQFDQTGYFALVVDQESRVKVRRVTLGPGHEGEIEITGGLEVGERLITEGLQKVRPNLIVQIAEATPSGK